MITEYETINKEEILSLCKKYKDDGYRFVAITAEKLEDRYEFTYHFDLNYEMKHVRVFLSFEDSLPSISTVFPAAFLIENEYQDLYGLIFEGLIIDYKGHLYLTQDGPVAPLA